MLGQTISNLVLEEQQNHVLNMPESPPRQYSLLVAFLKLRTAARTRERTCALIDIGDHKEKQ